MQRQRRPARQNYIRTNGCRNLGCQLIVWLIAYSAISICFIIFFRDLILKLRTLYLLILSIVYIVTFVPIIICYAILVAKDPVDPNILQGPFLQQQFQRVQRPRNTKLCTFCGIYVQLTTQHCLWCNRCTDRMYCHSFRLNNCISQKDLQIFLCLTRCLTLNTLLATIESIIIFLKRDDEELQDLISNKQVWGVTMCAVAIGFFCSLGVTIKAYCLYFIGKTQLQHEMQATDSDSSQEDP